MRDKSARHALQSILRQWLDSPAGRTSSDRDRILRTSARLDDPACSIASEDADILIDRVMEVAEVGSPEGSCMISYILGRSG